MNVSRGGSNWTKNIEWEWLDGGMGLYTTHDISFQYVYNNNNNNNNNIVVKMTIEQMKPHTRTYRRFWKWKMCKLKNNAKRPTQTMNHSFRYVNSFNFLFCLLMQHIFTFDRISQWLIINRIILSFEYIIYVYIYILRTYCIGIDFRAFCLFVYTLIYPSHFCSAAYNHSKHTSAY